jgi:hypothetical protein
MIVLDQQICELILENIDFAFEMGQYNFNKLKKEDAFYIDKQSHPK